MKRTKIILLSVLTLAIFSVGFRYGTGARFSGLQNIYLYDSLLFASDSLSGISVYAVSDAAAPRLKMTIPIKGNTGMAFKDNILYANSYGGLLALRIHSDSLYDVVKVIQQGHAMDEGMYPYMGNDVVGPFSCGGMSAPMSSDATNKGTTGAGGSLAIFAVIDTFLYYVNGYGVVTMSIGNPADPTELCTTPVNWPIETIFPTDKYLYIGGQ